MSGADNPTSGLTVIAITVLPEEVAEIEARIFPRQFGIEMVTYRISLLVNARTCVPNCAWHRQSG